MPPQRANRFLPDALDAEYGLMSKNRGTLKSLKSHINLWMMSIASWRTFAYQDNILKVKL